jgi:hypothetical protein
MAGDHSLQRVTLEEQSAAAASGGTKTAGEDVVSDR